MCISQLEIIHVIFKNPEVITNLDFTKLTTMPLELQGGISIDSDTVSDDDAYLFTAIDRLHRTIIELND